jgi:hypothetical protein
MVYASGWNPAYSFDDVGAAALPAAAAAVGLEKLAIMGAQSPVQLMMARGSNSASVPTAGVTLQWPALMHKACE